MTVMFQTMEESRATENNQAPMNDASMTIEFLRARLLSERAASKSARQHVRELTEKLAELADRLEKEVEERRKAEAAMEKLVLVLKLKGINLEEGHGCQGFESCSSMDSTMDTSEKPSEIESHESYHQNESHENGHNNAGDQQNPESHHSEDSVSNAVGNLNLSKCELGLGVKGCIQNDTEVVPCQKESQEDASPEKEHKGDTTSNSITSQLKSKLSNVIAKEVESLPQDERSKVDIQTWLNNIGKLFEDAEKKSHSSQEEDQSNGNSKNTEKTKDIRVDNFDPITSSDGKDGESNTTLHQPTMQRSAYPSNVYPLFNRSCSTNDTSNFSTQFLYASGPVCTADMLPYPPTVDPLLHVKGTVHSKGSAMSNGVQNGSFQCDISGQPWYQNSVSTVRPEVPSEIYMKQQVNMTRGPGYQRRHPYYPRYNVMERGIKSTPNSLADEKNGRLASILTALNEARQQISKDQQLVDVTFAGVQNHAPIVQYPPSPSSEYVCPLVERYDMLRRSKSASSNRTNHMMSNLQLHSKPREVDLGNGITLYTD